MGFMRLILNNCAVAVWLATVVSRSGAREDHASPIGRRQKTVPRRRASAQSPRPSQASAMRVEQLRVEQLSQLLSKTIESIVLLYQETIETIDLL